MFGFSQLHQQADDAMRRGDFSAASQYYSASWNDYVEQRQQAQANGCLRELDRMFTPKDAFWLLMSGGNSQFCAGDYAGCLEACELTLMAFRELGCVVGNPFFHLRAGQASFELDEGGSHDPAGTSIDNLARALICGGVEIFNKEDDKYLDSVLEVLEPPQGYSSWREATGQGCSVDLLNGATGFLVDSLIEKYGSTPPYN